MNKELKELLIFGAAVSVFVIFMCYHFRASLDLPKTGSVQNELSIAAPTYKD